MYLFDELLSKIEMFVYSLRVYVCLKLSKVHDHECGCMADFVTMTDIYLCCYRYCHQNLVTLAQVALYLTGIGVEGNVAIFTMVRYS